MEPGDTFEAGSISSMRLTLRPAALVGLDRLSDYKLQPGLYRWL